MPKVYSWLKKLHFCGFPPTCLLCGAAGEGDRDLCAGCAADLPLNSPACYCCAIPLAGGTELLCGRCQQQPPHFSQAFVPLLYQPPVDFLIKALKFQGRLTVARLLGDWLSEALADRSNPLPQAIIPVPLHAARMRERGFNQALEIARPIARRLGIPMLPNAVSRIRHTAPQMGLDARTRRSNIHGAFIVSQPIQLQHVAILDDVVTTASTVAEIAKVLRTAGVQEITIWACARTPH
ncbi:MAG: ComF family protein [Candidatus Competibacteraceae bacterium]|nr:ComF family protein [Candidatus Competibacteraceae bacterium]